MDGCADGHVMGTDVYVFSRSTENDIIPDFNSIIEDMTAAQCGNVDFIFDDIS